MIISVSKRTDIPGLYGEWFIERLKEGFAFSVNPFNPRMIKKVSLLKEDVTAFVFWTKNPGPFLKYLDKLDGYNYYFQFTLTPYGKDLEASLPSKDVLIDTFVDLSNRIGKEKVVWRYDPIILTRHYTVKKHMALFEEYCQDLSDYTEKVVISFVDEYKKNQTSFSKLGIQELSDDQMRILAGGLSTIARKYGLRIETCAEEIDLSEFGLMHTKCIDDQLISRISKKEVIYQKDPYQRDQCLCNKSVDIGSYDTCIFGCLYCYAVKRKDKALSNYTRHHVMDKSLLGLEIDEQNIKVQKKDRTIFD